MISPCPRRFRCSLCLIPSNNRQSGKIESSRKICLKIFSNIFFNFLMTNFPFQRGRYVTHTTLDFEFFKNLIFRHYLRWNQNRPCCSPLLVFRVLHEVSRYPTHPNFHHPKSGRICVSFRGVQDYRQIPWSISLLVLLSAVSFKSWAKYLPIKYE